jgi:acyl-CoA reductase-like NAD-dependent aldehyde dehydrogenase
MDFRGPSTDHMLRESLSTEREQSKQFKCYVIVLYSSSPYSIPVLNPATNEPLTNVTSASPTDVDNAILAAQEAFTAGTWSRAPALHRATVLTRLARLLEARVPDLARVESMQTGRTIREMKVQLARLPEWM